MPADTTDGSAPAPALRVLVVEDNADAQYLVCEMLAAFGHQPRAADSGEAALAALQTAPFDVLFTDVSLPGISGLTLARQARSACPQLGVIVASGLADQLAGELDFPCELLKKPYQLAQLQAALARAANRVRPADASR